MRPLPSWSLSEPFCSTSWSMAVYSSSSTHVLLLAVLQQWSLILLSVWLVWHISSYCQVQVSKARLVFEELMYWFVKTRAIRWSTVVKAIPSCGGDHFLHRQVQELHASTTSFIFGLWMYLVSCNHSVVHCVCPMLSVNSPNATTLHSRCIWEGVLRV